ncbi:hypothetical protein PJ311_01800 [Bacillus sp. CLL-7-23]|uniref:DUF6792 domain-containing protein n=1 Tax=Bacillus changyiensis TaxID=3004103 RepID=A0ABT4X1M6_9BACI|nr:DUF6792 domain-containing protein [Bacillus changyiensis]MDA7025341.1 hypothetical protein [Bacillus changyiensis]
MASKNIFANETVKIRLIDLEYRYKKRFNTTNKSDLAKAKQDFAADVRRIYKEETNKELPKNIEIYTSKELLKNKGEDIKNSGYDGTAIHIKDKKHNTDQLQIISQGSQEDRDWEYNFFGLFEGIDDSEYKGAKAFTKEAKKKTGNPKSVKSYAMGHSLANNNQVLVQLTDGEFDEVYALNGAQISIDHLLNIDEKLTIYISKKFNISRNNIIDSIPPEKLKKAIIKYYKDKGVTANITQRISKDDPLYGASGKGDFIFFGDVKMTDTNPDIKGLRSVIDHISDEDVRNLKRYFQQYTGAYKNGGLKSFVKEASGADIDLIEGFINADGYIDKYWYWRDHKEEIEEMITKMDSKIPDLVKLIEKIKNYSGPILNQLEENGYINETKKKQLQIQINEIYNQVKHLEKQYEKFKKAWKDHDLDGLIDAGQECYDIVQDLMKSGPKLWEDIQDLLKLIGEGHGLTPMLNALARKGFSYQGEDMYYSKKGKDGKEIKVNLSSSLRIYREGLKAVSEVEDQIDNYCRIIQHEFDHDFDQKKRDLKTEIHRMEATPILAKFSLQVLLQSGFSHIGDNIEKVNVHESFETAPLPQFDGIVKELKNIASEKKQFVEDVRSSIEKLLDHDKTISAMFNYQPQEAG